MSKNFKICDREIGENHPPLVIAEIGINHGGDFKKAKQMISDAHHSGAECVKFQCHIIEDEMIPNQIIPANATESIWEIMKKCSFSILTSRKFRLKILLNDNGNQYRILLNIMYICVCKGVREADVQRLGRAGVTLSLIHI